MRASESLLRIVQGIEQSKLLSAFRCFLLYILLMCIAVITVRFVCCSVKLPLSQPTSFCLFLSILLPTPAGAGATEQLVVVASHNQSATLSEHTILSSATK